MQPHLTTKQQNNKTTTKQQNNKTTIIIPRAVGEELPCAQVWFTLQGIGDDEFMGQ